MPEFHDLFWKSLFQKIENIIEFFRTLFGEKVNLLVFEGAILRNEIYLTKSNYSASSQSGVQKGHEGINLKIGSNPTDTKEV